jgi:transcriptional regulator with XRE-family HTH domain
VRLASFAAQMKQASANERAEMGALLERENMAELERKAITARIQQARKEVGLTQPEMYEALHVHERTYQNYESQKHPRVPWGLLDQIATITGKSTKWLIHGDDAAGGDANGTPTQAQLDRIEATQKEILAKLAPLAETVSRDLEPSVRLLEAWRKDVDAGQAAPGTQRKGPQARNRRRRDAG